MPRFSCVIIPWAISVGLLLPVANNLVAEEPTNTLRTSDPVATDDRTAPDEEQPSLPEWIHHGNRRDGEVIVWVCSSKQFATVEEAEADVLATLRATVLEELHKLHPDYPMRRRSELVSEKFLQSLIKNRHVQMVQRDFGTFFAPMYRVWLQAELTPLNRQAVQFSYTRAVQEGRLLVVSVILVGLLCLPLGIVSYGNICRWKGVSSSRLLQALVSLLVIGVWAISYVLLQRYVILF